MDDRSPPEPDDLPENLIHLVKPELQPGERLLWASRGGAGSASTASGPSLETWTWFLGLAASSVGCLGASLWAYNRQYEGAVGGFLAFGLITGIVAFFFVLWFLQSRSSGRSERRKIEGQAYALTDLRAIIWLPRAGTAVSVHTFQRGTIKAEDLHRVQYPDGSGNVWLRAPRLHPSGFLGIAEVRRVEEMVRRFLVAPGQGPDTASESHLD